MSSFLAKVREEGRRDFAYISGEQRPGQWLLKKTLEPKELPHKIEDSLKRRS